MRFVAEALNSRRVESYAVFKGAGKLVGHYGNVLLRAVYVGKREPHEFYVLFLNVLDYFFMRIIHISPFPSRFAICDLSK